jgi:hypothetical protein
MSGPEPVDYEAPDYDALPFELPPPAYELPPPAYEPPPPAYEPPPPAFAGRPEAALYDNPDDLARARRPRSAEVLPETSFVDRYRGTQYDTAPPAPVVEAQPRKRRPPTWLLLVAGAALLMAGLAGGLYVAFNAPKPGGLNGFRGMTPGPAGVYIVPSPSVDPSAAIALSTPTPGPTAPPWATDPLHPAGLFITNMTAADASYHVEVNMTMTAAGEHAYIAESADVSGVDFASSMTMTTPAKTTSMSVIYKQGYGYAKLDNWPWVRRQVPAPTAGILGSADAYDWDGVEYVGPETVDGTLLHHVRVPIHGWPGSEELMTSLGISMAPPSYVWDVWVDADGRPRVATIHTTFTMRIDGHDVQVATDSDYSFSKFGKRITIETPKRYRQG